MAAWGGYPSSQRGAPMRFPPIRSWLMACLLLLLAVPWSAQAYDNDTHYVLTYYLARKVGFTMEQARQIASANVSVDAEPMTEPLQTGQVLNPSGDAQTPRWLFHAF